MIVRTAIEIGLTQVTVKEIAKRLGVTPPAIYSHVRSRDDIVELAVRELAITKMQPSASFRHWADAIRATATEMFDLLVAEPQLVCEVLNGVPSRNGEIDFVEYFLEALAPFGFTPSEGVRIQHSLAMLVIGASVVAIRVNSGQADGLSHREAATRTFEQRPLNELPLLRKASSAFKDLEGRQWHELLELFIKDIAAKRGEKLPRPSRRPSSSSTVAGAT